MMKVNPKTKTIIVDLAKVSADEKEQIQMYLNAGYLLKKPQKSNNKGDKRKKEDLRKELAGDKENLAILEKKLKDKENFMRIKQWVDSLK